MKRWHRVVPCLVFVCSLGSGCASGADRAETAEKLLCPELAGASDPLGLSFSEDARADGRIRAFVAASRGLYDAAVEMESLVVDACVGIQKDLGRPLVRLPSPDTACRPVLEAIAAATQGQVELRLAVAPPRCEVDAERLQQCNATCGGAGAECVSACQLQGELYGRGSLPGVSLAMSSQTSELIALGQALQRHLPRLIYAQMALGKRVQQQAAALVAVCPRLPSDLANAGPRGLACVSVGATTLGKSLGHINTVVAASSALLQPLNPEPAPGAVL